jgi:hypothetical protein
MGSEILRFAQDDSPLHLTVDQSGAIGSEVLRFAQDDSPLHLTVDQSGAIGREILRFAQDDRAGPCCCCGTVTCM